MVHVVGVSEMKVTGRPEDRVITYALGSCVGVTVYDRSTGAGGLLHFQLPNSQNCRQDMNFNPCMYADTGFDALIRRLTGMGAKKNRLRFKLAGGGCANGRKDFFQIGKKNCLEIRKVMWKNNIIPDGEYLESSNPLTMWLDMRDGRTYIREKGTVYEI